MSFVARGAVRDRAIIPPRSLEKLDSRGKAVIPAQGSLGVSKRRSGQRRRKGPLPVGHQTPYGLVQIAPHGFAQRRGVDLARGNPDATLGVNQPAQSLPLRHEMEVANAQRAFHGILQAKTRTARIDSRRVKEAKASSDSLKRAGHSFPKQPVSVHASDRTPSTSSSEYDNSRVRRAGSSHTMLRHPL